jgi:hypothetical protein
MMTPTRKGIQLRFHPEKKTTKGRLSAVAAVATLRKILRTVLPAAVPARDGARRNAITKDVIDMRGRKRRGKAASVTLGSLQVAASSHSAAVAAAPGSIRLVLARVSRQGLKASMVEPFTP